MLYLIFSSANLFVFYFQQNALRFPISFVITDKYLFIFNFDKGRLYKLDEDNVLVSTVNIDTLFVEGAFADIIFNKESSRCFVRCNNNKKVLLKEINLETGEYLNTISLGFPNVDKIRIVNNYIYYTVPINGEYGMERQLYKQKLD